MFKQLIIFSLLFTLAFTATSHAADLAGSKDHPLIKRYEGSEIVKYATKSYDEFTLAMGNGTTGSSFTKSEKLEGALTRILYRVPQGHTSLEIMRNYQAMLKDAGFNQLFEQPADSFAWINYFTSKLWWQSQASGGYNPLEENVIKTPRYVAARKTDAGKSITVSLFVAESKGTNWPNPDGKTKTEIKADEILVLLDVVESKALEQKMVEVKANDMAKAIAETGKIAIYGITFDVDKADIKPESKPTLDEVATLLKSDAALKLEISGHTDNTGTKEHNIDLSLSRAASVVKELTTNYAIDAARLTAKGFGDEKPVADNATEDGRAKNRRVELTKI